MFSWGVMKLNVNTGTYKPPYAKTKIAEIDILPPSGSDTPAEVTQQGGKKKKRTSWSGFCDSWADFESLQSDWAAGTERVFIGPDSVNLTCFISFVSEPIRHAANDIEYSIILTEA